MCVQTYVGRHTRGKPTDLIYLQILGTIKITIINAKIIWMTSKKDYQIKNEKVSDLSK